MNDNVGKPHQLGPSECSAICESIRSSVAGMGLIIPPESDLGRLLVKVEWLGGFADMLEAAKSSDNDTAVEALLAAEQGYHLSMALACLGSASGLRSKIRHLLRNPVDRRVRRGQGLETLFEIETAGRLARLPFQVEFAEPDIQISDRTFGSIGIACKRPTKEGTVARCIGEAADQCSNAGIPSFVILGLDAFLMGSVLQSDTQLEFGERAQSELNALCQQYSKVIAQTFEKGIGGVILCIRFVAYVTEPSSYCWVFRTYGVPNFGLEDAGWTLRLLDKYLRAEATVVGLHGKCSLGLPSAMI